MFSTSAETAQVPNAFVPAVPRLALPSYPSPNTTKRQVAGHGHKHAYHLGTPHVESGEAEIQGRLLLHGEFKASLGYTGQHSTN